MKNVDKVKILEDKVKKLEYEIGRRDKAILTRDKMIERYQLELEESYRGLQQLSTIFSAYLKSVAGTSSEIRIPKEAVSEYIGKYVAAGTLDEEEQQYVIRFTERKKEEDN